MRLKDVVLSPYRSLLRGLGKAGTVPLGVFAGAVQIDDMETVQNFIVVADEKMEDDALLRYDFLSRFQFKLDANGFTFSSFSACPEVADINQISIHDYACPESNVNAPPQFAPMIRKLIDEYPTSMLAESPVQLRVVPDEKIKPFCHQPSRHPPFEAEAVKKQVDDWLKEGIVLPSTSRFDSRTVVVKKLQAQSRTRCDAEEARPWRQKYYS
ncbi:GD17727 [Drosophila simulans]|uniref:GD17727 n=1 Tax=Drosophila simulans TaxID=7240 RepID=B4NSW5_DROSI|nr:GD17727 [Drosophila simulans]